MTGDIRHAAVEGASLAYEVAGEGDVLLCVHGFGGSRASWDPVWPALSSGRRAMRFDQRGFGESIENQASLFSHAEDLIALLDDACVERCDLVGFSLGGAVAVNFALDHPERVRRLVLIGPALLGWDWSDEWRGSWRSVTTAARAGEMNTARRLWINHAMFAAARETPALSARLETEVARFPGRQWLEPDRQHPVPPDADRLATLDMPTLLLSGERDSPDLRAIADVLAALVPHLHRIDYAGCGHMLMLEAPDRVAADITAFLAEAHYSDRG
ncbi:MAG: alpha/beta hydrolase [Rhizorhabdus sp.]